MKDRTPDDGKPYYCALCGCGFGEYLACEEPDCRLETEAAASKRSKKSVSPSATDCAERRAVMSEQDNALSAPMAAGLLLQLKAECEAQHTRAERAEAENARLRARVARLEAALRDLASSHDGYRHGLGPCVCSSHQRARAVLEAKEMPPPSSAELDQITPHAVAHLALKRKTDVS